MVFRGFGGALAQALSVFKLRPLWWLNWTHSLMLKWGGACLRSSYFLFELCAHVMSQIVSFYLCSNVKCTNLQFLHSHIAVQCCAFARLRYTSFANLSSLYSHGFTTCLPLSSIWCFSFSLFLKHNVLNSYFNHTPVLLPFSHFTGSVFTNTKWKRLGQFVSTEGI